jgi:hypothetical protein
MNPGKAKNMSASMDGRVMAVSLMTLLALFGLLVSPGAAGDESPGDRTSRPLPNLKRVVVSPRYLTSILDQVRQGNLVKLPLEEFEGRVRRARAAVRERSPAPQLRKAHYRAILVSPAAGKAPKEKAEEPYAEPSLSGSGTWTVFHQGKAPGVLLLSPLSLALKQPRYENREALIGAFKGGEPGLLVDRAGEQPVMFDWTARGEETPAGIHFDWRVPMAPVSVLELELPAGRTLSVAPESCLVTRHPAGSPDRRLWKVYANGTTVLHLTVVPDPAEEETPGAGQPNVMIENILSRHNLAPEGEASEFSFDLRVVAQGARSLSFACDSPLTPYHVALLPGDPAQIKNFEYQPGRQPGDQGKLTIHFREAAHGTLHPRIFCRGPLGRLPPRGREQREHREWVCPGLTVLGGGAPRTETIKLRCHPQVKLEEWHPGGFRLTGAETEADGTYQLTLAATGVSPGGTRPAALLRTQGVDYRARVQFWWQITGAGAATAMVRITYDVRHGRLFELPLLVAPGYDVEQVWCGAPGRSGNGFAGTMPVPPEDARGPVPAGDSLQRVRSGGLAERLRNWTVKPAPEPVKGRKPGSMLLVELQPPLEATVGTDAGNGAELFALTVRLRGPGRPRFGPWTGMLPTLLPMGASGVEGGLAVDWDDDLYEATFTTQDARKQKVPLTPAEVPAGEEPWDERLPRAWFPWRGQPPVGQVRLVPRPVRLRTHTLNEARLTPGSLMVETHLTVTVEAGATEVLDLLLSPPPPGAGPLKWEVRPVGETVEGKPLSRTGPPGVDAPETPPVRRSGPGARPQVRSFERRTAAEAIEAAGLVLMAHPLRAATLLAPPQARSASEGTPQAWSARATPLWHSGLVPGLAGFQRWRLTLSRPLRARQRLVLQGTRQVPWPPAGDAADGAGVFWPVPLITFPLGEGEVRFHLDHGAPADGEARRDLVPSAGLTPSTGPLPAGGPVESSWRVYRHTSGDVSLLLRSRATGARVAGPRRDQQPGAVIPRATLLIRVEPDGRLVHRFTFEVRGWPQPLLPVRLPAGAQIAFARIDGREVTSLVLARAPAAPTDGEREISLPVPVVPGPFSVGRPEAHNSLQRTAGNGPETNEFEIVYILETGRRPLWPLASQVEAPTPVLPLRPLAFRRVWRLPAAYAPAGQGHLVRLPGAVPLQGEYPELPLGGRLPSLTGLVWQSLSLDRWASRQEQTVRAADARFRRRAADRKQTLAEAMRRLAFEGLADQGEVLVLDSGALAEAGLSPGQSFQVPASQTAQEPDPEEASGGPALASLQPLGLVYVPCRPAPLVTTNRQWQAWQHSGARGEVENGPVPESVARAVSSATVNGHDSSGRFRTVVDWLGHPGPGPALDLAPVDAVAAWVDWEDVADSDSLWLVRASAPSGLGLLLAGLLFLSVAFGRSQRARPGVRPHRPLGRLLLWLGGAGLALLWLPLGLRDLAWWPLATGCLLALWWYLTPGRAARHAAKTALRGSGRSTRGGSGVSPLTGGATAGVLALFWFAWAPAPAGPVPEGKEAVDVYLLPSAVPGQGASALVPPALLRRLDHPAQGDDAVLPAAVLVSADYHGTVLSDATVSSPGKTAKSVPGRARLEATFQIYCPGPGPAHLEVPLDAAATRNGFALAEEALLDGARVPLNPLAAPRLGYSVRVTGAGMHRLRLVFLVSVTVDESAGPSATTRGTRPGSPRKDRVRTGGGATSPIQARDLRFTVPRLAQSRLSLRLLRGSTYPQALVKLGAQTVTLPRGKGPLLEVDLGAPSDGRPERSEPTSIPLHFRWFASLNGPRIAPVARFREAHLWDLGRRGHSLTSVLRYTIGPGGVTRLTVDVPPGLMVSRAEARRPSSRPAVTADPAGIRLRAWVLGVAAGRDKPRPLHLDFRAPVTGDIEVLLVFHPRDALFVTPEGKRQPGPGRSPRTGRPGLAMPEVTTELPLPTPHGQREPKEGYLAYRLQGLEARVAGHQRIDGILPEQFPAFFWQAAGRGDPPAYAGRIIRSPSGVPMLNLAARPRPPRREGSLTLSWHLGPTHALLHGDLDLSAPDADLLLVECQVPGNVDVSAVTGPEVRSWSLAGGLLQVWLRRAVSRAHLVLTGSTPLGRLPALGKRSLHHGMIAGPALAAAWHQTRDGSTLFVLPPLRLGGIPTRIELTSPGGTTIISQTTRNLVPGKRTAASSIRSYDVRREDYAGRFVVEPACLPTARVVTALAVKTGGKGETRDLRLWVRMEIFSPGAPLRIHLDHWPGKAMLEETPGVVARLEPRRSREDPQTWSVSWSGEEKRQQALVLWLSGRVPLPAEVTGLGAGLPVPQVRVSGVAHLERWLALGAGTGRFQVEGVGVARTGPPAEFGLAGRPELLSNDRSAQVRAWRLSATEAGLYEVLPRLREEVPRNSAVQVVLREESATIPDARRWLHQTTWWLYHGAATDFSFVLPEGVALLGVSVDGRTVELHRDLHSPSSGARYTLALGGSGARRVSVRWYLGEGRELLVQPWLEGPQLSGAAEQEVPASWIFHVPASLHVASPGAFAGGPLAAARREIRQTEAQSRLIGLLLGPRPQGKTTTLPGGQLPACLEQFTRHAEIAEQLLRSLPPGHPEPAGVEESRTALRRLRQENREFLAAHGIKEAVSHPSSALGQIEENAWNLETLSETGRPLYRVSTPKSSPTGLSLVRASSVERRQALAGTGLLVFGLLLVWLLSAFPSFVALTRLFWPEQVLALGILGLQAFGPVWPVLFLLVLGGTARLLFLVSAVRKWLRRPREHEPQPA